MALWKIVPMADEGDPRWLDYPIWDEVVVRAPTAAQARLLAAEMERGEIDHQPPTGNESHSFRSGFEDEKLYLVTRLDPSERSNLASTGPEEVMQATNMRFVA